MQYNQNTKKQKQKNNCKMTYIFEPSTMQETQNINNKNVFTTIRTLKKQKTIYIFEPSTVQRHQNIKNKKDLSLGIHF